MLFGWGHSLPCYVPVTIVTNTFVCLNPFGLL